MGNSDFIPAGRTSLVRSGDLCLQLLTEYASRPRPRITTTISENGRVMHKIERGLDNPITTADQQKRAEETIKRQHAEVTAIVGQQPSLAGLAKVDVPTKLPPRRSIAEQLRELPSVERVYQADAEGRFPDGESSQRFQEAFAAIFKDLQELLDIFARLPGVEISRERGVYEVERNRLYLASAGTDFYFVTISNPRRDFDYEAAIKEIIVKSEFAT
jgi:hypothetical protein